MTMPRKHVFNLLAASWFPGIAQSIIAALILAGLGLIWKGRSRIAAFWSFWSFYRRNRLLLDSIRSINMRRFTRTRSDYRENRADTATIGAYVETAKHDLKIVGFTLITGVHFHELSESLLKMMKRDSPVEISVSLIDPRQNMLMHAIAPSFDCSAADFRAKVREALRKLLAIRESVPPERREGFKIFVHKAIPFGSAILIDTDHPDGRIQIETKAYKANLEQSWGFEIQAGGTHEFYHTLVTAYEKIIEDGAQVRDLTDIG
jgi:hypothetical protein